MSAVDLLALHEASQAGQVQHVHASFMLSCSFPDIREFSIVFEVVAS